MSAINANIVVETTTLTLSPSTTSIGVTVDPINLNVNTTDQGVPSKIANGTSNVDIATANGNITMSVDGTSNVAVIDATGVVVTGTTKSSGTVTAPAFTANTGLFTGDGGGLSNIAAGNVIGLNLSQISNGTSNVNIAASDGNVTVGVGGVANVITATTTGANIQSNLSIEGTTGNVTTAPDGVTIDGGSYTTVLRSNVQGGSSEVVFAEDYPGFGGVEKVLYAQTTAGNIARGPSLNLNLNDVIGNANTDPHVWSTISLNAYGGNSNLASTSESTRTSLQMGGQGGGFSSSTGLNMGTGFGQASWKQFQYQPGAMSFWRRNGNGEAKQGVVGNDKTTIEFIMASNNGSGSTTWASYPSHIAGKVDASFSGADNAVAPTGLEFQVAGDGGSYNRYYHEMYANGDTTFNSSGGGTPITLGYNGIITGDGGNLSNINGANVVGLSTSSISNGTSNVNIATVDGNIDMSVGGANVAVFSTTGAVYPGVLSVNGNITAKNDITAEAGANFVGSASLDVLKVSSNNISIGFRAGDTSQGSDSVAIGKDAGRVSQAGFAIAIGNSAGNLNQQSEGIAIGHNAGVTTQGTFAVAVGPSCGQTTQGSSAVAVGFGAGFNNQGGSAVAIGPAAGDVNQGIRAVAIGPRAGAVNQHDSSIVINATSSNLNSPDIATFTVKPVRQGGSSGSLPTGFVQMAYNPTTGEIVYYT